MHVSKPFRFTFGFLTIFVAGAFALLYYNQGVRTLNEAIDLSYNDLSIMARTSYVWLAVLGGYQIHESVYTRRIALPQFLFGLSVGVLGLCLTFLSLLWTGEFFMWTAVALMGLGGFVVCLCALKDTHAHTVTTA